MLSIQIDNNPIFVSVSPQVPAQVHRSPHTGRGKRDVLKSSLMASDPRCSECCIPLTPISNLINSAHLIRDALSCPGCVNKVRDRYKVKREQSIEQLPKEERLYIEQRRAEAARFKESRELASRRKAIFAKDPTCHHCGETLINVGGSPLSAFLVVDRLSCPAHVSIVRNLAFADSPRAAFTEAGVK